MALVQVPRVATAHRVPCEDSLDLEGSSPTSTEYEPVEFFSSDGRQQCRVDQTGPHRRALRWLVRKLNQHGKQQQQQQQQQGYLPSGSSYDSLSGLSDYSEYQYDGVVLLKSDQKTQQDQPACEQQYVNTPMPATAAAEPQQECKVEGGLRSLVKAVLRPIIRFVHHVCSSSGPQGPGTNDNSVAEQIMNVVTSIPFFAIGLRGLRERKCPKGRHFSIAFMAVGVVASLYHGVSPSSQVRPFFRKMDYYTICYTSNVLRRAAHIPLPRLVQLAALLAAPLKPSAVTGLNLLLVESKYLRHALAHSQLRPSFKLHIGAGAIGMAAFAYEDIATLNMGWPPVLHSLWHCLSAVAMGCTNSLLSHLELALLVEGVQATA